MITKESLTQLHKLAEERQRQVADNCDIETARELVRRAKGFLQSLRLPRPLRMALGRCL
jgi:hypothetical protein